MGSTTDREQDSKDYSRRVAIGDTWRFIRRKFENNNPATEVYVTGFSLKRNYDGDNPYKDDYLCILHGVLHGDRLVKFRQFHNLENLGYILSDMLRHEADWRRDKYG